MYDGQNMPEALSLNSFFCPGSRPKPKNSQPTKQGITFQELEAEDICEFVSKKPLLVALTL